MELRYEFEELSIITDLGWDILPVFGCADIGYGPDGEWTVRAIYLDKSRRVDGRWQFDDYRLDPDRDSFLFNAILDRLEHDRADSIGFRVAEALASGGIAMRDPNAGHRVREAV